MPGCGVLKRRNFQVHVSLGSAETLVTRSGIINHHSIAYSLSNISAKNHRNRLMWVESIVCNISVVFLRQYRCDGRRYVFGSSVRECFRAFLSASEQANFTNFIDDVAEVTDELIRFRRSRSQAQGYGHSVVKYLSELFWWSEAEASTLPDNFASFGNILSDSEGTNVA